ncbi:MAG TPA: hypothetical protein VLA19_18145 [Herpetosiphonaceae bacterium]|nr:hypothetical protein [Herpetosiphonaceae bacterium]
MKARLTVTDLTRMRGDRVCVGGCLDDGTCVRPVFASDGLREDWLYARGQVVIQPFAVVEFDFHEKVPRPPHTEDRKIDRIYRVRRVMLNPNERRALLLRILDHSVDTIFGTKIHREPGWYVQAGEGDRSLGTVQPRAIHALDIKCRTWSRFDYHVSFTDQCGEDYHLKVTDLAFQYFLHDLLSVQHLSPEEVAAQIVDAWSKRDTFFRIGLARGWEKYPDRCYLQLTGIYTFPDYLDGRCFADFTPAIPS